ncbi:unnamed protein product [Tuber aestivum]|uniref:Ubiquitin 3 binding protein But2 C-terminal domain-containing protein n=1 Tax=Tuber aestivum TaxID=59557 RepID=A0A292Q301_9PEZI|nr:unnamed protein product [Tuber aestivum]
MKFALVAAVSALSTVVSGLALPNLVLRAPQIFRPAVGLVVKEDNPNTAFPPTNTVEVSRKNGQHNVKTLLGFSLPPLPGKVCTISFSNGFTPSGSRRMQLFTTIGYPSNGNTWNSKPSTNVHKGTFLASVNGAGPATVVEDFGLTFDCPSSATNLGYEVQPVWDDDFITWDITTGGFVISAE